MLLVVGRLVRPHGVRGDLICEVRTDEPDDRFAAGSVLATDPADSGPLTLDQVRWHQGRLLVKFDGIDDRDAAGKLRGVLVCVDSAELDAPDDPEEFRDHDLVGLAVETDSGDRIGEIVRVDHGAAHDMLVVKRDTGKPALIPFIHRMVPTVDLPGGRVVVTLPEGLLDL